MTRLKNFSPDPRLSVFLRQDRIRVMRALIKLVREMETSDRPSELPGPYLSQIAREAKLNKRSTALALNAFEKVGITKASKWLELTIRGRPTYVKVFELKGPVDKIEQFVDTYGKLKR